MLISLADEINIDNYFPSVPHMAKSFGISISDIQLGFSFFQVFVALGTFIFGILAMYYSHRKLSLLAVFITIISLLLVPVFPNVYFFWLMRSVTGFALGGAITVSVIIMTEHFTGNTLAKVSSFMMMALALMPAISPLIGGIIEQSTHIWQLNFIIPAIICVLSFIYIYFLLPENKKEMVSKSDEKLSLTIILKDYFTPLTDRSMFFVLSSIFGLGWVYFIMTISPELYQVHFGLTPYQYGNISLLSGVIFLISSFINALLVERLGMKKITISGIIIAFIALMIGLFYYHSNMIDLIVILSGFLLGLSFVRINLFAVAQSFYQKKKGNMASIYLLLAFLFAPIFSYLAAFYQFKNIVALYEIAFLFMAFIAGTFFIGLLWMRKSKIIMINQRQTEA